MLNPAARQIILQASAHSIPLPDAMVHTCVTSPPYYSLRKYAGEQAVDWPAVDYAPMPGMATVHVPAMTTALGLEPDLESYIGHLVACFREVWRVMREDAVLWCVMGDSYANDTKWGGTTGGKHVKGLHGNTGIGQRNRRNIGLGQGDLMLVPHRLALALQGDGWVVRNDVVWHKIAPMPESVSGWRWERCRVKVRRLRGKMTQSFAKGSGRGDGDNPGGGIDQLPWNEYAPCPGCPKCEATGGYVLRRGSWRHTRAHETVIMAVKGMGYYADQGRVREGFADDRMGRDGGTAPSLRNRGGRNDGFTKPSGIDPSGNSGRNPRSVLSPAPESYPGDHYAVYPRTLIAPLLLATAPPRVCPVCGAPWAPVVERENTTIPVDERYGRVGHVGQPPQQSGWFWKEPNSQVLGHRPTCKCVGGYPGYRIDLAEPLDPIPGTVLDPFVGSGTTLAVCRELGVNCVGLDISARYLDDHAKPRIGLTPSGALETLPLFRNDNDV